MNGVPPFGGRKGLLRSPIRMGRVSEDASRLSTSTDQDALRPALMAFGRRYLHALDSHPEVTNSFRMGGWRSHPGSRDIFVPLDLPFATFDFAQWEEYRAIEALFTDRPVLRRLMTEPMYAPTGPVPEFQGLMFGVVVVSVERYHVIHGSDEQEFANLIEELTDWFCRDADPMFVATPVMGFTAVEPLMLAPDITVRRATDEEVSAMLEIGALNLGGRQNSTQVYTIQVPDAARWIVAMDHSRRRRFGSNGQEEDEPNLSRLKEAAGAWLATLRILTPAQVRLGPTLTTQLLGGIISGGSLNGDAPRVPFAWHNPATITPDNIATFAGLAKQIVGGRARQLGIAHGLHRFSEATTRSSFTDRLVDLAIALESLFSDRGDSVSYKVTRRASAMLTPLGLSAETVYEFVKAAYSSRSRIVHGGTPTHRNLAGEECLAEEQVRELDRLVAAIFRRVLSSSSDEKAAETAEKLINAALDSHSRPRTSDGSARYDATVGHDGQSFRAVLPAEDTFLVRGDTLEELRSRLAERLALWTQAPCEPDQIHLELDADAMAASS